FLGLLSVGSLIAFIGLLLNVGFSVVDLAQAIPDWLQATGGVQRVEELLAQEPDVVDAPTASELPRLSVGIAFKNVGFSYTGHGAHLADVTLTVPVGQSVAFVGRSGSGKS